MKKELSNELFGKNKIYPLILLVFLIASCKGNNQDSRTEFSSKRQNLPVFSVITPNDSTIQWDKKTDASLFIDSDKYNSLPHRIRIKYRGGSSSQYPKHSLTIDVKESIPIGGLPSRKRWILNANYIDKTFIRHVFHFDLFRAMNSKNIAPNSRFVLLKVNQNPKGLYVLMERVNDELLANQLGFRSPIIYKEPPLFYSDYEKRVENKKNPFNQKNPSIKEKDFNPELNKTARFIHHSSNQFFKTNVFTVFNLKSIIDWHLILLLSNNGDGVLKNFYLYQKDATSKYNIALWDYDHSIGRDGDNELNLIRSGIAIERNKLFERLIELNPSNYLGQLSFRWFELRDSEFSEKNILHLIDSLKNKITPYIPQNDSLWPSTDTTWYFDSNNFQEEISIIKKYFSLQLPRLDSTFQAYQISKKTEVFKE